MANNAGAGNRVVYYTGDVRIEEMKPIEHGRR